MGSQWGLSGVLVGSLWGPCGVPVGSLWGACGVLVGSVLGLFGVSVGSAWVCEGSVLGLPLMLILIATSGAAPPSLGEHARVVLRLV